MKSYRAARKKGDGILQQVRIGVAGAGVFGTYHAQKAAAAQCATLVGIFDVDIARANAAAEQFGAQAFDRLDAMLSEIDALVVAVPARFHEAMVERALRAGVHVLAEKPLTLSEATARTLAELAEARNLVLQVGHQERFVARAMGVLDIPEKPLRMESVRIAPPSGNGRAEDVSVIWDLMIHDLDLATCLIGGRFTGVSGTGRRAHTAHIDHAEVEFSYADGAHVKLLASRDSDVRVRTMLLEYPSGIVSVDFLTRRIENTTPHMVKIDISSELPDPLLAADTGFYHACLGRTASPVPAFGTVATVAMAEAAEAAVLASIGD